MAIPEQGSNEPSSPTFRRDLVSKVVKDICEGRLIFRVDQQGRRPEDIDLISGTVGRLVGYINDYVSGTKAGEEFEFLEKQLFFCISVLRTFDALKPNLNEAGMEASLRKIESKTDAIGLQLAEMLKTISETSKRPSAKPKKASKKKKRSSRRR